ncbi:MAG: 2-oxo acid dehydrogenase subunit E2, partial [Alkalispirochaeta sp.]
MKQAVEVPQVGESVTSGILAVWNVNDGDYVNEGDEIFELETDKATLPVPAPASGTISISVQADEEVEVGTTVAEIDTEGAPAAAGAGTGEGGAEAAAPGSASSDADADGHTTSSGSDHGQQPLSPAVRRVLEENGLSAATVAASVAPSGKDGRLTKGDVESYVKNRGQSAAAGGVSATAAPKSAAPKSAAPKPAPGSQERKKMTKLRQTIAANLVSSKQQSAHLTTFNEVDMTAAMELRKKYKESFEEKHGVRLGFMSFFVKAAQRALVDFPSVNAFVDGTEIIYNYFYNVGVAISTDAGLLVPVLRNVDTLSFADIESQIVDFAKRARDRRLLPDEFSGGT